MFEARSPLSRFLPIYQAILRDEEYTESMRKGKAYNYVLRNKGGVFKVVKGEIRPFKPKTGQIVTHKGDMVRVNLEKFSPKVLENAAHSVGYGRLLRVEILPSGVYLHKCAHTTTSYVVGHTRFYGGVIYDCATGKDIS